MDNMVIVVVENLSVLGEHVNAEIQVFVEARNSIGFLIYFTLIG